MLAEVTTEFDRVLMSIYGYHKELHKFFKDHPRKSLVLDRTCEQVKYYEKLFRTRLTLDGRNEIIRACVTVFCKAVLDLKEQELFSDIEKAKLLKDKDLEDEMKEILVEVSPE